MTAHDADRARWSAQLSAQREQARQLGEHELHVGYVQSEQRYEMAVASAERQYAMDTARARQQLEARRVNQRDDRLADYTLALADAERDRATRLADAKLAWQLADVQHREQFQTATTIADSQSTTELARIDKAYTVALAAAHAEKQLAYARADEEFTKAQVTIDNFQRLHLEKLDVTRWNAEAVDRVTAHATIDSQVDTPWSSFLHDVAGGQQQWSTELAPRHVQWIEGTNLAEATYQAAVSSAQLDRAGAGLAADQQHAVQVALAEYSHQMSHTAATADYVQQLLAPARTVTEVYATADRNYDAAVAQAVRDFAEHKAPERLARDKADALQRQSRARRTARQSYFAAEAAARATWQTAEADADLEQSLNLIAADHTRQEAKTTAESILRLAESGAYVDAVQMHSQLERDYLRADAILAAVTLADVASQHPSPWAQYEADRGAAYAGWVEAMAESKARTQVAQAERQRDLEMSLVRVEESRAAASLRTDTTVRTAVSRADHVWQTAAAAGQRIAGAAGVHRAVVPELATPPDVQRAYVISPAPNRFFRVNGVAGESYTWSAVPQESGLGPTADPYSIFLSGVQVPGLTDIGSSDAPTYFTLQDPRGPSLPRDFWHITPKLDNTQFPDTRWADRFAPGDNVQYISIESSAEFPTARMIAATSRFDTSYDTEAIGRRLAETDQDSADWWKARAILVRPYQPSRPEPLRGWSQLPPYGDPRLADTSARGRAQEPFAMVFPDDAALYSYGLLNATLIDMARSAAQREARARSGALSANTASTTQPESSLFKERNHLQQQSLQEGKDDRVIVDPWERVIWRSPQYSNQSVTLPQIDSAIGTLKPDGWVQLDSGGRATLSSLTKVAERFRRADDQKVSDAIAAVRSPHRVDPASQQIGIFIGGTGMHITGQGNVERLYNLYQGTKFYYGGVGNAVDCSVETLSSATGWGWTQIIDRAVADIRASYRPGMKLHLFGFSRGAAMANELARRLGAQQISVDFLGMFDPVYSFGVGTPGQDSDLVEGTFAGLRGNYVQATIHPHVKSALSIYSVNEERTWFPATRMTASATTRFDTLRSPGGHGEVGGHWESNMRIQHLNLRAMIESARNEGGAKLVFKGMDPEVQSVLHSQLSADLAMEGVAPEKLNDAAKRWDRARGPENWSPYSPTDYIAQLNNTKLEDWKPSGYEIQKHSLPNVAAVNNFFELKSWYRDCDIDLQPVRSHYHRDLSWVSHDLYDVFAAGVVDAAGKQHRVKQESIDFIRSLYPKKINPKGGWHGTPESP
jgi:hypothetical protein